jgi:hypothetical protein
MRYRFWLLTWHIAGDTTEKHQGTSNRMIFLFQLGSFCIWKGSSNHQYSDDKTASLIKELINFLILKQKYSILIKQSAYLLSILLKV